MSLPFTYHHMALVSCTVEYRALHGINQISDTVVVITPSVREIAMFNNEHATPFSCQRHHSKFEKYNVIIYFISVIILLEIF
jgi:hypothetical protein